MLSRHPMAESTYHDRALSDLIHARSRMHEVMPALNLEANPEEGHVFDHEPGYADYHHD